MKAKKTKYLTHRKAEKKNLDVSKYLKNPFWNALFRHELPINVQLFTLLSAVSGFSVFLLYAVLLKAGFSSIVVGILSSSIPYLVLKTPLMMSKQLKDASANKELVYLLQSALRTTNSPIEAMELIAEEQELPMVINELVKGIVVDTRLGIPFQIALDNAIKKCDNPYTKMAFTIIRINYDVGTSVTIDALDNIQDAMDDVTDNMGLLKGKIGGLISEKTLFLILNLAVPFFLSLSLNEILGNYYSEPFGIIVTSLIFIFVYAGQFIIDHYADKMIKEI